MKTLKQKVDKSDRIDKLEKELAKLKKAILEPIKNKWTKIGKLYWMSEVLGEMNWNEAKEKCKAVGGRLPTRIELMDLYDNHYGECRELIKNDLGWPFYYWSSTETSGAPTYAWTVYLYNGSTNNSTKGTAYRVRCVREKK